MKGKKECWRAKPADDWLAPRTGLRGEHGTYERVSLDQEVPTQQVRTWCAGSSTAEFAGPRRARRLCGPRPAPPRPSAPRPKPARRPRRSLRTGPPAPPAVADAAARKMAERAGAGGSTSLRGMRERMGERPGGSRGNSGPRGRRASRGPGDRWSGAEGARKLYSGVASRRPVLSSPAPEFPWTGERTVVGRGWGERPAGTTDGRSPPPPAEPRGRGARELTGAVGAGGGGVVVEGPGTPDPADGPELRLPLGGGGRPRSRRTDAPQPGMCGRPPRARAPGQPLQAPRAGSFPSARGARARILSHGRSPCLSQGLNLPHPPGQRRVRTEPWGAVALKVGGNLPLRCS